MSSIKNISLVIPVFNEEKTIKDLVVSIRNQSLLPAEVIFVDGGSTDTTVKVLENLCSQDAMFRLVMAGRAMPGKGRNVGTAVATHNWIAYTDAGITLDEKWLQHLYKRTEVDVAVDIVYGNFIPVTTTFFLKCAAITYVPPEKAGSIRGRSIASCLIKKEVWEKIGGFPDLRATEDLIFIEKAQQAGFKIAEAPAAEIYWDLRPTLASTFQKFVIYSKYNVLAGRQAYWHHSIRRQYLTIAIFSIAALLHHWLWILFIPAWFGAWAFRQLWRNREEHGLWLCFNPFALALIMILKFVIDMATFSGWIKAIYEKRGKTA